VQLAVYNERGEQVRLLDVADEVFGIEPNHAVMQQAYQAIVANRRAGTHSTKTRGEVAGSTVKTRRQKGLGRSRQGSIRAPHHRHGGIAFGPTPRDHDRAVPKMLRRLAIRSVLSAKAGDGEIKVIESLALDRPKTAIVRDLLAAIGVDRSGLIATGAVNRNLALSARNLPHTQVVPASVLNVADLLAYRYLVLTVDAVQRIEALWGGMRAEQRRAPAVEVA